MTRLLGAAAIASASLLLHGCNCLDAKAGTIKIDTDCGTSGDITHAQVTFAKVPAGTLTQTELGSKFLPPELAPLADQLGCDALFSKDIADLCSPIGVGGPLEQVNLSNLTDARVLMCGGKMVALGGGGDSLFLCTADRAVVDGQVWFMSCQRFTPANPQSPTGTCQGVAEFDAIEGVPGL